MARIRPKNQKIFRGARAEMIFCATQLRFVLASLGAARWWSLRGGGHPGPKYFEVNTTQPSQVVVVVLQPVATAVVAR
jgi:hypothetical protein